MDFCRHTVCGGGANLLFLHLRSAAWKMNFLPWTCSSQASSGSYRGGLLSSPIPVSRPECEICKALQETCCTCVAPHHPVACFSRYFGVYVLDPQFVQEKSAELVKLKELTDASQAALGL